MVEILFETNVYENYLSRWYPALKFIIETENILILKANSVLIFFSFFV